MSSGESCAKSLSVRESERKSERVIERNRDRVSERESGIEWERVRECESESQKTSMDS